MCRCGECFGCSAVPDYPTAIARMISNRDPGDEQQPCGPDNVGYARCSGGRDSCDGRWCRPTPTNNAPCIGCVERCGQCSES